MNARQLPTNSRGSTQGDALQVRQHHIKMAPPGDSTPYGLVAVRQAPGLLPEGVFHAPGVWMDADALQSPRPSPRGRGQVALPCVWIRPRRTHRARLVPWRGWAVLPVQCVDSPVTPWKPGMILAGQGRELPRCVWIRGGRTHAPADEPTRRDKGIPPGVWIGGGRRHSII